MPNFTLSFEIAIFIASISKTKKSLCLRGRRVRRVGRNGEGKEEGSGTKEKCGNRSGEPRGTAKRGEKVIRVLPTGGEREGERGEGGERNF